MSNFPASAAELYGMVFGVLAGNGKPEDRSGRNPLQALAEKIASFRKDAPELGLYSEAAANLIAESSTLSAAQVRELATFLLRCEQWSPRIKEATARALRRRSHQPEVVEKRADLLRLGYRSGIRLLPAEIQREEAVRNARPWLWFDLAVASQPEKAAEFVAQVATFDGFLKAMLARLTLLYKTLRSDDFNRLVAAVESTLDKSEQQQLRDYLGRFDIRVPAVPSMEPNASEQMEEAASSIQPLNRLLPSLC